MGKGNSKHDVQEKKDEFATKGHTPTKEDNLSEGLGKLYMPFARLKKRPNCCHICIKIMFVALAVLIMLHAIVVIAVCFTTAIATKMYSDDMSGRLVAMVILAVTAAVTICIAIYSLVAAVTNKTKAIHATTVVLIILAIIQAVIAAVAVRVTPQDELQLGRSLTESFALVRDDNHRHVKLWTTTQYELTCCGVYSPNDYRAANIPYYFPPDVPISCCPSYDPDRSELLQEREREFCKAKREFFELGCKDLVVEVFRDGSTIVLSCVIGLILLEVILAILGAVLWKRNQSLKEDDIRPAPDDSKHGELHA